MIRRYIGVTSKNNRFSKLLLLVILAISLFIIPLSINPLPDSSLIRISILDYDIGGCGGIINISGTITYWDNFASFLSLTLGVANFDTKSHTLKQVNVTITGNLATNYSSFNVVISITEDGNLPLILQPQCYWQHNFSFLRCTSSVSLRLMVDEQVLDFGMLNNEWGKFQTRWLSSWSNVHYYTESAISPLSSSVVLIAITGLVIFHRRKKK